MQKSVRVVKASERSVEQPNGEDGARDEREKTDERMKRKKGRDDRGLLLYPARGPSSTGPLRRAILCMNDTSARWTT